jgi:hypothetical protein
MLCPVCAWGWGSEGHEIVAIIAADNLTPAAQSHVANILGAPVDQIATAMEAASVRPDSEFREEDRSTAPWHFINILSARPSTGRSEAMPRWYLRHRQNR